LPRKIWIFLIGLLVVANIMDAAFFVAEWSIKGFKSAWNCWHEGFGTAMEVGQKLMGYRIRNCELEARIGKLEGRDVDSAS
jgi:hypothetical protein